MNGTVDEGGQDGPDEGRGMREGVPERHARAQERSRRDTTADRHTDDRRVDDQRVDDSSTDVEDQVRALLATTPDPGPMPPQLAARIAAALGDEAIGVVDAATRPPLALTPAEALVLRRQGDHEAITPLLSRRRRPNPVLAVAAVAAAAAVVAVGGSALHVTKRADGTAALSDLGADTTMSLATGAPGADAPHIQTSATDYTAATLPAQARQLLDQPALPLGTGAAEAPSLGPIATPLGLDGCLSALGVADPHAVTVDIALWNAVPAVVIVVTDPAGTSTAYVVQRDCQAADPHVIVPATAVP